MDETENTNRAHSELPPQAEIVVVGAGLAGLAAAALVAQRHDVVVLDAVGAGGRARTDDVGGFLFNRGAHALFDQGEAQRVLRRIGLRWSGSPPMTTSTHVRLGESVVPFPTTPTQMMTTRLLSWREKAAVAGFLRRLARSAPPRGWTAAEWFLDQGLTGRAFELVSVLARLCTYCEPGGISADAAGAQLALSLKGVTYLDGGWQTLVDALAERVRGAGARLVTGVSARTVRETAAGWCVETDSGELRCRSVVLAGGGPRVAERLLGVSPRWGDLGAPVTAAVLDLGLREPPRVPLLLSLDDPLYLSVHSPPARLCLPGNAVVHVMRYGARGAEADRAELGSHAAAAGIRDWADSGSLRCGSRGASQAESESAKRELRHATGDLSTGATGAPSVLESRFLARMVVAHSAPRAELGGLAGRPGVAVEGLDGVFLAGDWVGERGLLADAALASAESAAAAACDFLAAGRLPAADDRHDRAHDRADPSAEHRADRRAGNVGSVAR